MYSLQQLFPGNTGNALGWMILHLLWQATIISLITGIVLLALRNQPARIRYWVANAALLSILVAAVSTFLYYNTGTTPPPSVVQQISMEVPAPSTGTTSLQLSAPVLETPQVSPLNSAGVLDYFTIHLPLLVTCWFLGMSLFLLRFLGNIGYVFYLKKHLNFPADAYWNDLVREMTEKARISKTVALLESGLVKTPMLVGYLKPVILFPIGMINRLDPREAEAILAHELAHILHHDYLLNILQSIMETLFYFHPAVWWLSSRIRHEREMAADDVAVAITGNAVQYAKALVLVQDMALMPLTASLAFAGNRKSQLMRRIQHILNIQQSKSLAMEKFIGTCAIVLLLLGIGYAQNKNMIGKPDHYLQTTEAGNGYSGVWEGKIENDKVCLTLSSRSAHHQWVHGDCYLKSDFSALPTQEADFTMTRPAGVITFRGKFEGNEGYGRYDFAPDKSFADWLTKQGISGVDDDVMVALFFANTDKTYVTSLKEAGYQKISGDDLQNLAIHQVDKPLIETYRAIAKELGDEQPDINEMLTLKIHEIDREYIKSMAKSGFSNLKLDDILNAKIHEITPEYVQQCRAMGYTNLQFDDVLNFKIHEMSAGYLNDLKKSGISDLTADEALNMRIHEVSPESIAAFHKMGFENLSPDDIINLQIHEINPAFLNDLKNAGFEQLSVDDAVNCKIHGVSAESVKAWAQLGFNHLSVDDAVNLNIHEITPGFMGDLKNAGFTGLSVDDAVNCKIHEVTAESVKAFHQLGFNKISVDDAVNLKIHEVTPDFIQLMRNKGFKDMDMDDYIQLKIQYGEKMK